MADVEVRLFRPSYPLARGEHAPELSCTAGLDSAGHSELERFLRQLPPSERTLLRARFVALAELIR